MNEIIIKGLRAFAYHGINAEEKRDGQHFIIGLTASVDSSAACANDSIGDTVNYTGIAKTAIRVMTEQSYDLLGRVAQRVAGQIFQEYPTIVELEVLLTKPEVPIQAEFEYTMVSTTRKRSDFG